MDRAVIQPWMLLVVSIAIFLLFFTILHIVGFVPEVKGREEEVASETTSELAETAQAHTETIANPEPTRIIIDALGVDATIESPNSRDIEVLDDALLRGVVHYPGSGTMEEEDESNMLLFGHSSSLPVIHNQNFKVFNRLSELEAGNIIRVQGDGVENVYRVTNVELVDASEALIRFATGKKQLTLSTCNSFGAKSERFVVSADFVGSYQL